MLLNSRPRDWLAAGPVSVFHHIPKCGGTSVRNGLERWFIPVMDYGKPDEAADSKVDPQALRARHVLCGHFASTEMGLARRYPEILANPDRYRVFTFVRDPMRHRVSHYLHVRRAETRSMPPLESWLTEFGPNLLARSLGCSEDNWRRVLKQYCFVGVLEELQYSFDQLADILSKRRIKLPRINQSAEEGRLRDIAPSLKRRFEAENTLDYEIYQSVKEALSARR